LRLRPCGTRIHACSCRSSRAARRCVLIAARCTSSRVTRAPATTETVPAAESPVGPLVQDPRYRPVMDRAHGARPAAAAASARPACRAESGCSGAVLDAAAAAAHAGGGGSDREPVRTWPARARETLAPRKPARFARLRPEHRPAQLVQIRADPEAGWYPPSHW